MKLKITHDLRTDEIYYTRERPTNSTDTDKLIILSRVVVHFHFICATVLGIHIGCEQSMHGLYNTLCTVDAVRRFREKEREIVKWRMCVNDVNGGE